ncbi:response regulator transcription factor [Candidatus Saccharibacteria bacterium]|nr:response regulator transcription factor [Candidatus Saccharibacteria bacterium]
MVDVVNSPVHFPSTTGDMVSLLGGRFQFSTAEELVLVNGQEVPFGTRPWTILRGLAMPVGAYVSRPELFERVWGEHYTDKDYKRIKIALSKTRDRLDENLGLGIGRNLIITSSKSSYALYDPAQYSISK